MAQSILRRREVEKRVGLSRSAIYLAISEERFPRPIALSSRAVGWLESDIDEWISGRVAESRESGTADEPPSAGRRTGRR